MAAKPLTCEEVSELEADGMGHLVVRIFNKPYNSDELFSCKCCQDQTPFESDLNDDGECSTCEEEADDLDNDLAELMADWRADRL